MKNKLLALAEDKFSQKWTNVESTAFGKSKIGARYRLYLLMLAPLNFVKSIKVFKFFHRFLSHYALN